MGKEKIDEGGKPPTQLSSVIGREVWGGVHEGKQKKWEDVQVVEKLQDEDSDRNGREKEWWIAVDKQA